MPPPENTIDPQDGNNPPKKPESLDIDAILLPTKKIPTNTERINAGVLLEQEQNASLPTPEPAVIPPPPPKDQPAVKPLQTYKGDIESLIQDKNVSMVTIAAAEAEKRARASAVENEAGAERSSGVMMFLRSSLMILGGIALIAAASGLGLYIYLQMTATVDIPADTPAPFIAVDKTTVVALPQATIARSLMMQDLEKAKLGSTVSLGLIDRLLPAATTVTTEGDEMRTAIPAELFLPLIAPAIPEELVRTLAKEFLLGIHIFDGPQAFLVIRTDSYERAFAAMLAWERTLHTELTPLFTRNPRPRMPAEVSTPVDPVATSTATTAPPVAIVPTGFVDRIVENRDARVIVNETDDLLILWTFLDRNTIVITTNEYTLREIITRLGAPVTPGL